jgi:hypothetical protein
MPIKKDQAQNGMPKAPRKAAAEKKLTEPKKSPEAKEPKPASAGKAKLPAKKKEEVVTKAPEFTPEVIAVRAYFLAEKRRALGQSPDPTVDWLQAETEIFAEIEKFAAKTKKQKKA